jgi:catechol 2,3-dioxygenase-like lactoylglutathione lyase family enzyme
LDVLTSRIIIRPRDRARSRSFYRDTLGLAVYREFGDSDDPGVVFFIGGGFLEVSGGAADRDLTTSPASVLWLQVRDLAAEHRRLASAGVPIMRAPRQEPWGLREMWLSDPDGLPIVLVEVPEQHPLRRDTRR